jgi:hypothetical protein
MLLIAALIAYSKLGFSWGSFALYFLVPDLSFLGYFAGPRVGAICYNLAHSYIGAIACLGTGLFLPAPTIICLGIIWCAHIGFDRALGYGLKYFDGFAFTHLGRIGKFSLNAPSPINQDAAR